MKPSSEPIVTAKTYIKYKREGGHLEGFIPPKVVLVCYQQSTLKDLLGMHPDLQESDVFKYLYQIKNGAVGILGGWGQGAPALAVKMEQLIELGVKTFIAVGTAGSLMHEHAIGQFIIAEKALAEDGVAHLYLKGEDHAAATKDLKGAWDRYVQDCCQVCFIKANAWSFPALFKETPADIERVSKKGYSVVEMEAATLYAVAREKHAQALSLFVISDSMDLTSWTPHIKEDLVRQHLHQLAKWAFNFCHEL